MADVARQVEFLLIGYRNPNTDEPLENGEVFTYLDGTTTASALWTNRDKAANASNPITLDPNGRAEVYGDNVYKFEIYEQRDDDGTIGAHVETINGIDLFAGETLTDEWISQTGDISYDSGTSITIAGDVTTEYHDGRRIRVTGNATGTVYGTITGSSYTAGTNETTVNISWDSGNLTDEELAVSLSLLTASNPSTPQHKTVHNVAFYENDGSGNAVIRPPYNDQAIGALVQYENDGSSNAVIRPPYVDKAIGGVVQYEDNGSGVAVIDHPDKSAQLVHFGINATATEINTVADGTMARNNHVHSNITITAGTGLSGGGSLDATRTISLDPVARSSLKTTTGQVSNGGGFVNVTLPGGSYAFYPQTRMSSTLDFEWNAQTIGNHDGTYSFNGWTSFVTNITLRSTSTAGQDYIYAQTRYIQSSPPYNLGDGVVTGFVYMQLDTNGNIISTYIAEDPPWYGNTPGRAQRQYKAKNGKEYAEFKRSKYQQTGDLEDFGFIEIITEEITTELKNRGMDELPHPFGKVFDKDGNEIQTSVALIDPVDEDLTQRIVNEMLAGGDPVKMFRDDYIRVDNSAKSNRKGPPGVPIHAARWRNIKR